MRSDRFLSAEALCDRERLDEHADIFRCILRAPVVDRGVQRVFRPGKTGKQEAVHTREESTGTDAEAFDKFPDFIFISRKGNRKAGVLLTALFPVMGRIADDLGILDQFLIPALCLCKGFCLTRILLFGGKVGSSDIFTCRLLSRIGAGQLLQKDHDGGAVHEDMMKIRKQGITIFSVDDCKAVQIPFGVGEGPDQLILLRLSFEFLDVDPGCIRIRQKAHYSPV